MFCCALTAFIISQLYIAFTALRSAWIDRRDPDNAASWRLEDVVPEVARAAQRPRPNWQSFSLRRVLVLSLVSAAVLAGTCALEVISKRVDQTSPLRMVLASVMCSSAGLRPGR